MTVHRVSERVRAIAYEEAPLVACEGCGAPADLAGIDPETGERAAVCDECAERAAEA